jgi:hypothetical protein
MKLGSHMTEEQRARTSAGHMGQVPWNKGKPWLAEVREHMSAGQKGRITSDTTKAKLSAALKGRHLHSQTSEARAKISATHKGMLAWNKGIPMTDEQRAVNSATHMGLAMPETTRLAIRKANLGSHRTEEQCAKISAAQWRGGPRASKAKRRSLGFVPLNEPFVGSEGHHLDKEHVLYIPGELHQGIKHNIWTGRNMEKMNAAAFQWLRAPA